MKIHRWLPFLIAASAMTVFAQQDRGTIRGAVTDPQDLAVGGVPVLVRNLETGTIFRAVTNPAGVYVAPALAVGEYEVTASAAGFKQTKRSGIRLQVNQVLQIDLRMDVGSNTEIITVEGEIPLVETGSAVLGQVIENRRVVDLPINGRNAMALMMLTPNVRSNAGPTNSGFGDRALKFPMSASTEGRTR